MPGPERLHLTTTSLQNVVISSANDAIYYEVVTPKWDTSVTRVSKMDPKTNELEIIAELQNENTEKSTAKMTSTAVRLRGQQFRPTQDFWTKDGVAGSDARFRGKDGKHYQWIQYKGRLELIREQDPNSGPVAVYHRHRRHFFILRMSRQPYLEIQPSAMETLDSLIGESPLTFSFQSKRLNSCISVVSIDGAETPLQGQRSEHRTLIHDHHGAIFPSACNSLRLVIDYNYWH